MATALPNPSKTVGKIRAKQESVSNFEQINPSVLRPSLYRPTPIYIQGLIISKSGIGLGLITALSTARFTCKLSTAWLGKDMTGVRCEFHPIIFNGNAATEFQI